VNISAEPWYSEHWLQDYLADSDRYDELDRQFALRNRQQVQ
jgi:hypothetical protein